MQRTRRTQPATIISVVALFVAAGGTAYAASQLPQGSVGSSQIKRHAVTQSKLGTESVNSRALGSAIRTKLNRPIPPQVVDAAPVTYSASASSSPTKQTAVDFNGLTAKFSCELDGSNNVIVHSFLTSNVDATLQDHFEVDGGNDPHVPSALQAGTLQIDLPANNEVSSSGPQASPGQFGRVMATAIYSAGSKEMTFQIASIADAINNKCTVNGTLLAPQ